MFCFENKKLYMYVSVVVVQVNNPSWGLAHKQGVFSHHSHIIHILFVKFTNNLCISGQPEEFRFNSNILKLFD